MPGTDTLKLLQDVSATTKQFVVTEFLLLTTVITYQKQRRAHFVCELPEQYRSRLFAATPYRARRSMHHHAYYATVARRNAGRGTLEHNASCTPPCKDGPCFMGDIDYGFQDGSLLSREHLRQSNIPSTSMVRFQANN
jgi:hypothetical protein